MMNQLSREARNCIDDCLRCQAVCLTTAMTHCLEMGGDHVRPQHFRLMMDCVLICDVAADLLAHKSQFHHRTCALCADVCATCATDCEKLEGMEECVAACRSCAESCRAMAA